MVSISFRMGAGSDVSSRDKKARRAQLRDFLVATPGAIDRAGDALGWLVVLGAVALGALLLHLAFAPRGAPPPPVGQGDYPRATLFVRDLGRVPDGRHRFDLVYEMVLHNAGEPPFSAAFMWKRLLIGDPAVAGDVIDLGASPGMAGAPGGGTAWHEVASRRLSAPGQPGTELLPGQWLTWRAHYRVVATTDQFADIVIGYGLHHRGRGWFGAQDHAVEDAHDEEVQLGAVVRAHCGLGVKVQNGEMRSLCGS